MPYAPLVGFALSPTRFAAGLALPAGHPSRPHSSLINVVTLWALRVSDIPEFLDYEDLYIERAVTALQEATGGGEALVNVDVSLSKATKLFVLIFNIALGYGTSSHIRHTSICIACPLLFRRRSSSRGPVPL